MIRRHVILLLKRVTFLRLLLINMGLLDELITGFAFVGLPLLRDQLGLTYQQIGLIFSAGAFSSILFEPPLYLLSDRRSKRWWILGGLLGLTFAFVLAGSTRSFIILLAAFALMYPANGMAVGLAQAALIDDAPGDSARLMTRWTLLSSIGDFLSPLAVTAIVAFGLGWTGLCWIAAACWLAAALLLLPQRFPRPLSFHSHNDDEAPMGIWAGLRLALRDTVLLRWAVLSVLTTMLDEIFLTFMVLYLRDILHASQVVSGLTIGAGMVAGFLGLVLLERLLGRVAPLHLLRSASLVALLGILGLLLVRTLWFAPLALFIMSMGSACLYPIVESAAYARLPGRSGLVRSIIGIGQPFEIVLPAVVGLIAGRFGLLAALVFLGSAPILFLALAPREKL